MNPSRLALLILLILTLGLSSCVGVSLFSHHDDDTAQHETIAPVHPV